MVLSFKLAKTGTRYQPKPKLQSTAVSEDDPEEIVNGRSYKDKEIQRDGVSKGNKDAGRLSTSFLSSSGHVTTVDVEVSFTLNLFSEGYSIVKPTENLAAHRAAVQEDPKLLLPYDRASETFFAAIESGRFPGDTLDDIPCKYVNGMIVCEVQDYRKCASERGQGLCVDGLPSVHKLCLRMSLENVVKDIPLISDDSWTYGDLMEAESRILKALQPSLFLDPTPKLDRLCEDPIPKLNLDISSMRKKRLREVPEVTVTCHTNIHGKKVCIDRIPESSNGRVGAVGDQINIPSDMMRQQNDVPNNMHGTRPRSYTSDTSCQQVYNQQRYPMNIANARLMQDHGSRPVMNVSGAASGVQDILSYTDNINTTSLQGKREIHDGQLSPLSNLSKRPRIMPDGPENISQQHIGSFADGFQGQNPQWKNSVLQHQLQTRGMQYTNSGVQNYQSQVFDGLQNQDVGMAAYSSAQGTKFLPKEEQIKSEKMEGSEPGQRRNDMHVTEQETINLDPQQLQFSQRLPQNAFNRPGFSQAHWNSLGPQIVEKKEDNIAKRKSAQSPRVSAGSLAQSPLSSKSNEFSSGSLGAQFGVGTAPTPFGTSQKDKSVMNTLPSVGGMPYMTSSGNDSIQRQQPPKRRTNSLPKTQGLSGVASPASVSTASVPLNASSPSVGTPPLADQIMLERFTKIEMISNRYNLNAKKNKSDNYPRKPIAHSSQLVTQSLAHAAAIEDMKDDKWPLSKSIVSGSMNELKIRVLNFIQPERVVQGNVVSVVPRARTRLIMTEKSNDGTVAMHFGEIEDGDFMAAEDFLHTLPNTHKADLLAAQSCSLMIREGYHVEDHIQLKPVRAIPQPSNQQVGCFNTLNEKQQYAEADTNQAADQMAKPTSSDNAPMTSNQSHLAGNRMLPPSNQALQMSQGLLSGVSMPARPQQLDQQSMIQQQAQLQQPLQQNQHSLIHQQQPQFQRPAHMMGTNPLSHLSHGQGSNMQLGNQMVSKPSPTALQILQQQQQQGQPQQQQAQMQRKLMMGLGNTMGMGNMGNNLVGLGGMGNVMNMAAARGIRGVGISAPMGPIAGVGNMGQNPININQNGMNVISQQLSNGQITLEQAQMLVTKMRMVQGRTGMMTGPNPQANIPGLSAARQMHPNSAASLAMLGHRANMNPMQQRAGMGVGPMGPPKLMAGVNPYMNQQQQQMQFQQMQQQLQLQHQHQQQQPQQQVQLQQQLVQPQQQPSQESTSPLQSIVTPPPQVSSPSTLVMPQQQVASPSQQVSQQRTPMSPQLSSGAVHATGVGVNNPEAAPPTSPQLSSQTLGSVGSISNSPMELQGVNKSNSNA